MSQCTPWIDMCGLLGAAKAPIFCQEAAQRTPLAAGDKAAAAPAAAAAAAPASSDACIADSTAASCAGYTYPDALAEADVAKLCAAMPDMSGCSLRGSCKAGRISGAPCRPFALLGDICQVRGLLHWA